MVDAATIFWPTGKPFEHAQTSWGETEGGYFYSSYDFAVSEHAGALDHQAKRMT